MLTRMTLYLSHISALEHLRSQQAAALSLAIASARGTTALRAAGAPKPHGTLPASPAGGNAALCAPTYGEFEQLKQQGFEYLSNPVHLLAPSVEDRIRRKGLTCHACAQNFPKDSFVNAAENVLASSPNLCLVQMSTMMPFPKLIALGCEFAGVYRLSADNPRGFLDAAPEITIASLSRFLSRVDGMHGTKTARRVLAYIIERSASPMETNVVLLLCLPRRLGGYGLPRPQMNARIDVGRRARKAASKKYYRCDLFWSEANLAVEYESDLRHMSSDSMANDSARRSALAYLGVEVVTLTKRQVLNVHELDRVALLLSKKLLKRVPAATNTWIRKRNELRSQLLDFRS